MTQRNSEPRNPDTPEPRPGQRVPPGETPPGESSMSGAGPRESYNPTKGWTKGPTVVIWLIVLCFAVFCVAYALAL
ncbi:DUF6480 family protein [Streptomyces sp. NPDC018031]|uniref:DUF6480 family protein n=1 Tax=Streptomyces sp. NPDC018031 TaxID=3365033 RepID=UPI0037959CA6